MKGGIARRNCGKSGLLLCFHSVFSVVLYNLIAFLWWEVCQLFSNGSNAIHALLAS